MPRTTKKETKKNDFKEFNFSGENGNEFSGRLYSAKELQNCDSYGLSLTVNGLAIVGAHLIVTEDNAFISMPQYKGTDGKYHSHVYFYGKDDIADLNALVSYLCEKVIG